MPSSGLIGWWSFSGNANDSSGNLNHGTVKGAALGSDRFGKINKAYYFSSLTDNITFSSIKQVDVLKYTVSGWFMKLSGSANKEGTIFCGSNPQTVNGLRFAIGSENQAAWGVENKGSSVWSNSVSKNFADDTWHFFAVVFDANTGEVDSNELKIYIDGEEIPKIQKTWGTKSNVTAPVNNQNLPTIIGNVPGLDNNFRGKIDDIGIWSRVLTPQEISNLYNTKAGIDESYLKNKIRIYPNPTSSKVNVDTPLDFSGSTYSITDALGKTIATGKLEAENTTIELDNFNKGIYILSIGQNIKQTYRIVKL